MLTFKDKNTSAPDFITMLVQDRNPSTLGTKKITLLIVALFTLLLLGMLLVAFGFADQKISAPVSANTMMSSGSDDETSEPKIANWYYLKRKDRMTIRKDYAVCHSIAHLKGAYPSASMSIWIQGSAGLNEVMLCSLGCDFLSSTVGELSLLVQFDHENPVPFQFRPADDGNKNTIFIIDANRFIQRLKTAQKITINAHYSKGVTHHANFKVKGLIWDSGTMKW